MLWEDVLWEDELSRAETVSFDDKNMRLGQWCWGSRVERQKT